MTTRRLMGLVAVTPMVLVVLGGILPFSRRAETCVICRLDKVISTYGPIPVTTLEETDCSLWYVVHVEPVHTHIWERSHGVYESGILGMGRSIGCRIGHCPIYKLPISTQIRVYQQFKNPLIAKSLFANLTDAKSYNDRLDKDDEDRGHLTVRAMSEWEAAGFPGTWDDWWSRFYANHVAERKEYIEWFNSDSKMGFDEWRRQRRSADRAGQGR